MNKWISVKDRVPVVKEVNDIYATCKASDKVLSVCKDGTFAIVQYEVDDDGSHYWTRSDGGGEQITHWIPLPQLPK